MRSVSDYQQLIPAPNYSKPKFRATIGALANIAVDATSLLQALQTTFDLDTATGVQLDQIGLWIGISRIVQVPISGVYFSWDTTGLGWEQGYWQGEFDPSAGPQVLDDLTYRQLLRARALANRWDGSYGTLKPIYDVYFAGRTTNTVTIGNGLNMTMSVTVNGPSLTGVDASVIRNNYIIELPAGVAVTYTIP